MGHIHFGYEDPDEQSSEKLVKLFDIFVTLPSMFKDTDDRRRQMYGKAGCFRFKEFGVEARVLSNFWIFNDELMSWIYDSIEKMVEIFNDEVVTDRLIDKYSLRTQAAINNNDKEEVEKLIEEINKELIKKETKILV